MVSFEAFKFLIQESYDAKSFEHDLKGNKLRSYLKPWFDLALHAKKKSVMAEMAEKPGFPESRLCRNLGSSHTKIHLRVSYRSSQEPKG
jgi:hypothetical protein